MSTMGIPTVQENQSELAVTTGKSILKNIIFKPLEGNSLSSR